MKLFYALVILLFSYSCSFDNKTGIWKNENIIIKDQTNQFEDFKSLSSTEETFNKIIPIRNKFTFSLTRNTSPNKWTDKYYSDSNNFTECSYFFKRFFTIARRYTMKGVIILESIEV